MPFISSRHESCMGLSVGTGHCVSLVREVTGAPNTAQWRRGAQVRGSNDLAPGTVIATFDESGRYGNHVDGRSHAALLLAVKDDGLMVVDQWTGRPVHERLIKYRNGAGDAADDGDRFFVVEGVA